jgi:hypothetical protein
MEEAVVVEYDLRPDEVPSKVHLSMLVASDPLPSFGRDHRRNRLVSPFLSWVLPERDLAS